jgi:hypothetical protein
MWISTDSNCENGFYPHLIPLENKWYDFLLFHRSSCIPCSYSHLSNSCIELCNNQAISYLLNDKSLRYQRDIVVTTIFSSILFGISIPPILTWIFINIYESYFYLISLPVHGYSIEEKWNNISERISYASFFEENTFDHHYCYLLKFFDLLLCGLFLTLSERYRNCFYLIPVLHFFDWTINLESKITSKPAQHVV